MPQLTTLVLNANASLRDLTPVSSLPALTDLSVSYVKTMKNVAFLTGRKTLSKLSLSSHATLDDVDDTAISHLENLETLYLSGKDFSDYSQLNGLAKLSTLTLSQTRPEDLMALTELSSLKERSIGNAALDDISFVSQMPWLSRIRFRNNLIVDLSPLGEAGMDSITELELSYNEIEDISPLAACTNLISLEITNNAINDVTPLANLNQLSTLYLDYNGISDFSPLLNNEGLGEGDTISIEGGTCDDQRQSVVDELLSRSPAYLYSSCGDYP